MGESVPAQMGVAVLAVVMAASVPESAVSETKDEAQSAKSAAQEAIRTAAKASRTALESVQAAERVFDNVVAGNDPAAAEEAAAAANVAVATAGVVLTATKAAASAVRRYASASAATPHSRNRIDFYGGLASSVEVGNTQNIKPDVAVQANRVLFPIDCSQNPDPCNEGPNIAGWFEARMSGLGTLESPDEAAAVSKQLSHFATSGPIFRADVGIEFAFQHFAIGQYAGMTRLPRAEPSDPGETYRRIVSGLAVTTNYERIGRARLFLGFADDRMWGNQSRDRYVLDAQLTRVFDSEKGLRYGARIYWDTPRHGNGPADLRISLFVEQELRKLAGVLGIGSAEAQ